MGADSPDDSLLFAGGLPGPALVRQWAAANAFPLLAFSQPEEVEAIVLRGHPCLLFVDGNDGAGPRVRAGPPAQAATPSPRSFR